jgi:hypothetical protein
MTHGNDHKVNVVPSGVASLLMPKNGEAIHCTLAVAMEQSTNLSLSDQAQKKLCLVEYPDTFDKQSIKERCMSKNNEESSISSPNSICCFL